MTLQSRALKNEGYPLLVLRSSSLNDGGGGGEEEGKSGGRMSSFAREVGEVLHMFQYIKNFQKPAQMPRRPICSFASLLPPGVEWSRPVAELSGKWHCPSLAGVGQADQGRAAGRQARGWAGDGRASPRGCSQAGPKPPTAFTPNHFPRFICAALCLPVAELPGGLTFCWG